MNDRVRGGVNVHGKCLRCGDCCRLMCKAPFMLGADGICKYLTSDNLCAIQRMTPGRRKWVAKRALEYWTNNCAPFPSYIETQNPQQLRDALNRIKWPTERCGYTVVITTDG